QRGSYGLIDLAGHDLDRLELRQTRRQAQRRLKPSDWCRERPHCQNRSRRIRLESSTEVERIGQFLMDPVAASPPESRPICTWRATAIHVARATASNVPASP